MAWVVPLRSSELLHHGYLLLMASWAHRGSRVLPLLLLQRSIGPLEKPAQPGQLHCLVNLSHTENYKAEWFLCAAGKWAAERLSKCIFCSQFAIGLEGKGSQKTRNKSIGRRWWRALIKDVAGFWTELWSNSATRSSQDPDQQNFDWIQAASIRACINIPCFTAFPLPSFCCRT